MEKHLGSPLPGNGPLRGVTVHPADTRVSKGKHWNTPRVGGRVFLPDRGPGGASSISAQPPSASRLGGKRLHLWELQSPVCLGRTARHFSKAVWCPAAVPVAGLQRGRWLPSGPPTPAVSSFQVPHVLFCAPRGPFSAHRCPGTAHNISHTPLELHSSRCVHEY